MKRSDRLSQLLNYLKQDPKNLALLTDSISAAVDQGELIRAAELIEQYRQIAELPPALRNMAGIVAMRSGEREAARATFEALREAGHDHPAVRFNLAWLNALENRFGDTLVLLDNDVLQAVPQAAALKVQALHHTATPEEAVAVGKELLDAFPANDALLGAVSVAAMDADDFTLAAALAEKANGGADALTTQGLVALNDNAPGTALDLFERALTEQPDAPRAWLGKGLGLLMSGDVDAAAAALERGAAIWDDHLGSWIAAGWAQFVRKDHSAARRNFETALAHDDNFAETHGGLAVLDLAEGKIDSARRRTEVALRLDRNCFGAALARAMLLESDGKPDVAQQLVERVMHLPVGVNGKTLAQALIGLGLARLPPGTASSHGSKALQ